MIIDTHCHYNLEPLYSTWQEHLQKAQQHGVERSIVIGTNQDSSQRAIELATANDSLFAAVGLHPEEVTEWLTKTYTSDPTYDFAKERESDTESQTSWVAELTAKERVVAIGECGLDYFRLPEDPHLADLIRAAQQQVLHAHLRIASQLKLPLALHVRDSDLSEDPQAHTAYWDTLRCLKESYTSPRPFVLHCLSGPLPYVKQAVEMGGFMGVAGNVTYKNAGQLRELLAAVPAERVLLETDAPFLPPQDFRGKLCEPWMISLTAEYVVKERRINYEQLVKNTFGVFKF